MKHWWLLFLSLSLMASPAGAAEPKGVARDERVLDMVRKVDAANVYELVKALDNPIYRTDAMASLVKIGAPAVDPLLDQLKNEKFQNQGALIETLGKLGPAASKSWPVLISMGNDKDHDLVAQIFTALKNNGPALVPALITGMHNTDVQVRVVSIRLLSELGPQAEAAVPELRAVLQDRSNSSLLRFWAVAALNAIGPGAAPAIPELHQALQEMELRDRYVAAQALGRIGPAASVAIPQLMSMVKERKSLQNADVALEALVGMRGAAVPSLIQLLRSSGKHRTLQEIASEALTRIGKPAVPLLLQALSAQEQGIVDQVATILVRIGEPAVADLLSLMRETPNQRLKFIVAQIVAHIPTAAPQAVPGLVAGLEDRDMQERMAAARALAVVGPAAVSAVPALLAALQTDLDVAARRHGAGFPEMYVGQIGEALVSCGEGAIESLHRALIDKNPVVQSVAVQALASLGKIHKREVLSRMVGSLMVTEPILNERAMQVLTGIQPTAYAMAHLGPKAIPGLTEVLRRGTTGLRVSAAHALAMQGPVAVNALVGCLVEPELTVRLTAVQALGAMEAMAEPAVPALILALHMKAEMAQTPNIKPEIWQEYAVTIAQTLGQIGEPAIPRLIELLQDEEPDMQAAAATALSKMESKARPAVDALRGCLRGEDIDVRLAVLHALHRIGTPAVGAVPELVELLRHPADIYRRGEQRPDMEQGYCRAIADTLGRMGQEAVPQLLPLLQDQDLIVRNHVAFALYKIKIKPKSMEEIKPELHQGLIQLLDSESLVVRIVAAKALAGIGPDAQDAIPALIKAVKTSEVVIPDDQFGEDLVEDYLPGIVEALDEIGEASVEPLLAAAKEDNAALRGVAAWALKRIAPEANQLVQLGEGSIPVLISAIPFWDTDFGSQASDALVEMGDVAVRPLLEAHTTGRHFQVRGAERTLALMYETSALAIIEGLSDPDPTIRAAAARALGGPKPAGPQSIPVSDSITALTAALKDPDARVRHNAGHSLRWLDARLAEQLGVEPVRKIKDVLNEIYGVPVPPDLPGLPPYKQEPTGKR